MHFEEFLLNYVLAAAARGVTSASLQTRKPGVSPTVAALAVEEWDAVQKAVMEQRA